jgi:hypothetical protein
VSIVDQRRLPRTLPGVPPDQLGDQAEFLLEQCVGGFHIHRDHRAGDEVGGHNATAIPQSIVGRNRTDAPLH